MSETRPADAGIANQLRSIVRQNAKSVRSGKQNPADLQAVREGETILRQGRKIAELRAELDAEKAEVVRLVRALAEEKEASTALRAQAEAALAAKPAEIARRPRGRPRKTEQPAVQAEAPVRRPRGRPRKTVPPVLADLGEPIWNPGWHSPRW